LHPEIKGSLLTQFIDQNVAVRGKAKKEMFKARMEGNKLLELLKTSEQANKKISNNSLSGAHVSKSTPLNNKTAHSTLTSTCRTTSGYGNANNEKLLSGNRHYWAPSIVLNNIVSITNHSDLPKIRAAMAKYSLAYPTVDQVMECIKFSTDLYWRDNLATAQLRALVQNLDEDERAAFIYTSDFYQLKRLNEDFVRALVTKLASPITTPIENPAEVFKKNRDEYRVLAVQFFPDQMRGKQMRDIVGTEIENNVAATVQHIHDTLEEYRDLIDAFLVTTNVPASLANFPDSVRRAALISDTDSTIFTVQDWVQWHQGYMAFDQMGQAVAATMIFLAAESVTHILARMSANLGVVESRIHQIAMKNEFKFDVIVPTQVGKHYFALIGCQEGNMYKHHEMEIKGVHLKSSNVPKYFMKQAEEMMKKIMYDTMEGKKISLNYYLKFVADLEREIRASVIKGESKFMRLAQIKSVESYTKEAEDSPYQNYTFWQEVWAPKYGEAPPPPYSCAKVSVELASKLKITRWIDSIVDPQLKARLTAWNEKTQKASMTTMMIPEQVLSSRGMPLEVLGIIDMRKIIFDISSVYYLVLETLGFYCVNKNVTRLVSDVY
jgi:hypothetical protein